MDTRERGQRRSGMEVFEALAGEGGGEGLSPEEMRELARHAEAEIRERRERMNMNRAPREERLGLVVFVVIVGAFALWGAHAIWGWTGVALVAGAATAALSAVILWRTKPLGQGEIDPSRCCWRCGFDLSGVPRPIEPARLRWLDAGPRQCPECSECWPMIPPLEPTREPWFKPGSD